VGCVATVMRSAATLFFMFDMGCTAIALFIGALFFHLMNMSAFSTAIGMLEKE
jgi:hypothetical protein